MANLNLVAISSWTAIGHGFNAEWQKEQHPHWMKIINISKTKGFDFPETDDRYTTSYTSYTIYADKRVLDFVEPIHRNEEL